MCCLAALALAVFFCCSIVCPRSGRVAADCARSERACGIRTGRAHGTVGGGSRSADAHNTLCHSRFRLVALARGFARTRSSCSMLRVAYCLCLTIPPPAHPAQLGMILIIEKPPPRSPCPPHRGNWKVTPGCPWLVGGPMVHWGSCNSSRPQSEFRPLRDEDLTMGEQRRPCAERAVSAR